MGIISSTWELIKTTCQFILERIFGRRMDWQEKFTELGFEINPKYTPEPPDVELREKCVEYINSKFPNGVEYAVNNSTVDERVELLKTLAQDLSAIYGVKLDDIILYSPKSEYESRAAGYYSPSDNSLHLNISLVYQEDWKMSAEAFLTVFHELKHARQWAAIKGWNDYGYSPELLYAWALNWENENYISFMECDEGYRKQPLEFDAFEFEDQFKPMFVPQNS